LSRPSDYPGEPVTESWIKLASYGAEYEADLAVGRLTAAGIETRVDHRGGVGLFGAGHGGKTVRGVEVYVPAAQVEAARRALDLE